MKRNAKSALILIIAAAMLTSIMLDTGQVQASSDYKLTVSYAVIGGGKPTAPTLIYVDTNGKPQTYAIGTTPHEVAIQKGTHWEVKEKSTLPGSSTEQWYCPEKTVFEGTAPKNGGSDTFAWTYYHQVKVTFDATTSVKGDSSTAIVTIGCEDKTGAQLPFTTGWINCDDSLSYSFKTPITSSLNPSTARYIWTSTSGGLGQTLQSNTFKVTSAGTVMGNYLPAYYLTVNSPYGTRTGAGWYNLDAAAYAGLNIGEIDHGNGTKHVFTQWTGDATGTGLASNAIEMNKPKTATAAWATQHQVSFVVNPVGQGTILPSSTSWFGTGATVQISATAASGYAFKSWVATGSIVIADPTSSTTTATINGPGAITATLKQSIPIATSMTIKCIPSIVDKTGTDTTTIRGNLTNGDTGIQGKRIVLSYIDGPNWIQIGFNTTTADGNYTYTWDVPATLANGQYVIKAEFAGDTSYSASSASLGTIGNGGRLFVVPEYLFGALASLAACFVALVVFRNRQKLRHEKAARSQS